LKAQALVVQIPMLCSTSSSARTVSPLFLLYYWLTAKLISHVIHGSRRSRYKGSASDPQDLDGPFASCSFDAANSIMTEFLSVTESTQKLAQPHGYPTNQEMSTIIIPIKPLLQLAFRLCNT
jgi:hypothetical protein